ncbi:MauE/DoxX family redox-associated membrane protein [Mucilaginibacter sp.]|uniref:MauE/DoxX family redox-associated membrane protein n=1 Tax=Mucilaginibacter sp. TaxID=1882438 RepID=UPI003266588B
MRKFIRTAAPALLILLFVYAALSKLLDFPAFNWQMHNQNVPPEAASVLVYLVPGLELLAAVLLLFSRTQVAGLLLSAFLLLVFSGYILLVLGGFWDSVPCSCGGVLRGMGWGQHLAFNLFFLFLSITALIDKKGKAENLRKE